MVDSDGREIGVNPDPPSNESRGQFVVRVANDLKNETGDQLLAAVVDSLRRRWEEGHADKEDLVSLLDALTKRGLGGKDAVFISAQKCLSIKFEQIDDFRAVARFANKYPDAMTQTELENVKSKFLEFAADYSGGWTDEDPDWLRQVAGDLEFVAENLELDVKSFITGLHQQADEIEIERAENEPDEDDRGDWEPSSSRDDVNDMFQSLREDLEG